LLVSLKCQGSFLPVNRGVRAVKPCLSKYQVMRDGSNYGLQYRWMPIKSEQGFREVFKAILDGSSRTAHSDWSFRLLSSRRVRVFSGIQRLRVTAKVTGATKLRVSVKVTDSRVVGENQKWEKELLHGIAEGVCSSGKSLFQTSCSVCCQRSQTLEGGISQ